MLISTFSGGLFFILVHEKFSLNEKSSHEQLLKHTQKETSVSNE